MKKIIISGLLAASSLVANPVYAQTDSFEQTEAVTTDPLSSDEAWEKALNNGTTDVELLKRREIAPGIFPKRLEMKSLVDNGCFVGGDVIGSDPTITRMMAAGQQCTNAFRKEVNERKKAGSTTFYVHQMMLGYSIRIDKRGSKEQGNTTCDAFSPFGSVDPINFACFNDMSGHQRVAGFATAVGQDIVRGGINFGLMRSQRRNVTKVENNSGSQAGADSASTATGGGGSGPTTVNITNSPVAIAEALVSEFNPNCPTSTCR